MATEPDDAATAAAQAAVVVDAAPAVAVWCGPDGVFVCMDLEGVRRPSVRVSVAQGVLEIVGARAQRPGPLEPRAGDGGAAALHSMASAHAPSFPVRLRHGRAFRRTWPLPHGSAAGDVVADVRDGVLAVRLPPHRRPAAAPATERAPRATAGREGREGREGPGATPPRAPGPLANRPPTRPEGPR